MYNWGRPRWMDGGGGGRHKSRFSTRQRELPIVRDVHGGALVRCQVNGPSRVAHMLCLSAADAMAITSSKHMTDAGLIIVRAWQRQSLTRSTASCSGSSPQRAVRRRRRGAPSSRGAGNSSATATPPLGAPNLGGAAVAAAQEAAAGGARADVGDGAYSGGGCGCARWGPRRAERKKTSRIARSRRCGQASSESRVPLSLLARSAASDDCTPAEALGRTFGAGAPSAGATQATVTARHLAAAAERRRASAGSLMAASPAGGGVKIITLWLPTAEGEAAERTPWARSGAVGHAVLRDIAAHFSRVDALNAGVALRAFPSVRLAARGVVVHPARRSVRFEDCSERGRCGECRPTFPWPCARCTTACFSNATSLALVNTAMRVLAKGGGPAARLHRSPAWQKGRRRFLS